MQALFVLESGFGVDDGKLQQGSRLFGRQAFIGMREGSYGALTFGRQYTSLFDGLSNFGPLSFAPLYEPVVALLGAAFREDNTIKYKGSFGGFTAIAHWNFGTGLGSLGVVPLAGGGAGESPGHFRDNSGYGATLTYFGGPVGITIGYDQLNPAITAGHAGTARKAAVAGAYTFGSATIMAGYRWGQGKDDVGSTLLRDDLYWLGVRYQATAGLGMNVGYYYQDLKAVRVDPATPTVNPVNPWQISLVTDYSFSKRTDIYLTMAYAKNSGLNFDTSATGFASGYFLSQGSNSQYGVAMGVRHQF